MGTAAAKAARKLGLYVLGIRRSGRPHRYVHEMGTAEFLSKWLPRTDFVIVTAPLTPDTEGLLDDHALGRLRPEASLINLGRARIVDYDALRQRLDDGLLRGAVLDVFDPEPLPPTSPLWTASNMILTPHVSSDDENNYGPLTIDLVFENLARWAVANPSATWSTEHCTTKSKSHPRMALRIVVCRPAKADYTQLIRNCFSSPYRCGYVST